MSALLLTVLIFFPSQSTPAPLTPARIPVAGTVFLPDGKPASGARVFALKHDFDWHLPPLEVATDTQGRYRFLLEPANWALFALRGSQGGEGIGQELTREIRVQENRHPDPIDIGLEERGILKARVLTEESNQPISGAKVILGNGVTLVTDSNGEIEFGGLATGNHRLGVVAAGRMTKVLSFSQAGNQTSMLEIRVPKGSVLRGQVKDYSGKPVAGARVGHWFLGSMDWSIFNRVTTGVNGDYELNSFGPPEHKGSLYVSSGRKWIQDSKDFFFEKENQKIDIFVGMEIKDVLKVPIPVEFRTVRGQVLNTQAAPIRDATVIWRKSGSSYEHGSIQDRTNDQGEFQLNVPQEEGEVAIYCRGWVPHVAKISSTGDQSILCNLNRGKTITAKVIDDRGEPISGAWIAPRTPGQCSFEPTKALAVRTDSLGRFELSGVEDGMSFRLIHSGIGQMEKPLFQDGVPTNPIVFPRPGIIRGQVSDSEGRPVRNFSIDISETVKDKRIYLRKDVRYFYESYHGASFTSTDGAFTMAGLKPGKTYSLVARATGFGDGKAESIPSVPLNDKQNQEQVLLKVTSPKEWKVKVVDRHGKPIKAAKLWLQRATYAAPHDLEWDGALEAGSDQLFRLSDDTGRAQFSGVGQSSGTLLIQAQGFARQRVSWNHLMKETVITLLPEAILEGEVISHPIWFKQGDFSLELTQSNGEKDHFRFKGQAHGKFRFDGLPAGRSYIYVQFGLSSRYADSDIPIDLKEGQNPFFRNKPFNDTEETDPAK